MRTHVLSRLMALESSGKHLPASTPLSLCAPNAVRPAKKQKTSTDHDYLYNYIDFIVNLYYQTIKKKMVTQRFKSQTPQTQCKSHIKT